MQPIPTQQSDAPRQATSGPSPQAQAPSTQLWEQQSASLRQLPPCSAQQTPFEQGRPLQQLEPLVQARPAAAHAQLPLMQLCEQQSALLSQPLPLGAQQAPSVQGRLLQHSPLVWQATPATTQLQAPSAQFRLQQSKFDWQAPAPATQPASNGKPLDAAPDELAPIVWPAVELAPVLPLPPVDAAPLLVPPLPPDAGEPLLPPPALLVAAPDAPPLEPGRQRPAWQVCPLRQSRSVLHVACTHCPCTQRSPLRQDRSDWHCVSLGQPAASATAAASQRKAVGGSASLRTRVSIGAADNLSPWAGSGHSFSPPPLAGDELPARGANRNRS